MKNLFFVLLIVLMFSACGDSSKVAAEKHKKVDELRHTLFVECMELSAKMPRQSDDDVNKIISECGSQAEYMSNYLYD